MHSSLLGADHLRHRFPRWMWGGMLLVVVSLILPIVRRRSELSTYVTAASRYVAGEQMYRPDDPPSFAYPPFLVLPFVLLLPWPDYPRAVLWSLCNLTMGVLCVRELVRLTRPIVLDGFARTGIPIRYAVLGIAVLASRFAISPLEYQSNDLIVAICVLVSLRFLAHDAPLAAGSWGGLAAACKATPLLFLPMLLWQRRYGAAASFCVVMSVATLLPDALVRNPEHELWVQTWYNRFVSKVGLADAANAEGAWSSWNPLNQSLAGTIHRWTNPAPTHLADRNIARVHLSSQQVWFVTLAGKIGVLLCVAAATRTLPRRSVVQDQSWLTFGQGGCVLCGMLLLSPMTSTQHFVVLVVPITFVVVSFLYRRGSTGLAMVLICMALLGPLAAQDLVGSTWADLLQDYGGSTAFTLLALITSERILAAERSAHSVTDSRGHG